MGINCLSVWDVPIGTPPAWDNNFMGHHRESPGIAGILDGMGSAHHIPFREWLRLEILVQREVSFAGKINDKDVRYD